MKIGLVSGSFSNGQETVKVKVGKTVTLVSQPDGVRYVIKLVSVSQGLAPQAPGPRRRRRMSSDLRRRTLRSLE